MPTDPTQNAASTAAKSSGDCPICGFAVYPGLVHTCSTVARGYTPTAYTDAPPDVPMIPVVTTPMSGLPPWQCPVCGVVYAGWVPNCHNSHAPQRPLPEDRPVSIDEGLSNDR